MHFTPGWMLWQDESVIFAGISSIYTIRIKIIAYIKESERVWLVWCDYYIIVGNYIHLYAVQSHLADGQDPGQKRGGRGGADG